MEGPLDGFYVDILKVDEGRAWFQVISSPFPIKGEASARIFDRDPGLNESSDGEK